MRFFGGKKYSVIKVRKRDMPAGLWVKCPACNEIVYKSQIEAGNEVCPKCDHHFPLSWKKRLDLLVEPGSFREFDEDMASVDVLEFTGAGAYCDKLKKNMEKTGLNEAVVCGDAMIGPHKTAIAVMEFAFLGGSMGSVVGEKVTRLIERATAERLPVVIVGASGGARMYEGMFSLMQMAKTSAALARHVQARLPYISVLTHPTMAGVMASFASLGDVIIAEPCALIGFAGPRVIRETTREEVPPGFQRSEFVLKHGLVDMIIHRRDLKNTIVGLLGYLLNTPVNTVADVGIEQ